MNRDRRRETPAGAVQGSSLGSSANLILPSDLPRLKPDRDRGEHARFFVHVGDNQWIDLNPLDFQVMILPAGASVGLLAKMRKSGICVNGNEEQCWILRTRVSTDPAD